MGPGVGVKKAEGFAPCGRIHNLIYVRQSDQVLLARFVDTGVVDAHSPFATLPFHQHGVGQPLGVVYLPDEARRKEFLNLFSYGLALVAVKMSQTNSFYLTGLALGSMLILCSVTSLGCPTCRMATTQRHQDFLSGNARALPLAPA
jgi:hypothetical protein